MNLLALPAILVYKLSGKPIRDAIDIDVNRYLRWSTSAPKSKLKRLNLCLIRKKEFRSVFSYRIRHHKRLLPILNLLLPRLKTIEIGNGSIGSGLQISHYHSVIFCDAGRNLSIGPGVVIGRNGTFFPKIGNNVFIAANSTVIGNVTIGDNVIVGAGSVVTKNLPSNGVYIGNPARLYKEITPDSIYMKQIE